MSTGMYEKLLRPAGSREETNDIAHAEQTTQMVESLGLLLPGSVPDESLKQLNRYNLGSGAYGAFSHDKPHGHIRGLSAGARFTRRCSFEASATVVGVEFSDDDDLTAPDLVHVIVTGDPIKVMFVGCTFRRGASNGPHHVLVDATARVVFVGCTFLGASNVSGDVISHAGAIGNVQVVACMSHTGNSLGTVTATAVL